MSFMLQAPYPQIAVTTFLPSPQFNDSRALPVKVKARYMTDGTRFTYVETSDNVKLHFDFILTRAKMEELKQFVMAFMSVKILIQTHLDEVWAGYLMNNPFEAVSVRTAQGRAREIDSVTLVFQGKLVTGVTLGC